MNVIVTEEKGPNSLLPVVLKMMEYVSVIKYIRHFNKAAKSDQNDSRLGCWVYFFEASFFRAGIRRSVASPFLT